MKITPMQQIIILSLFGFAVLGFLYYYFALKPINKDIVALQATLDDKKKELEEAKKIVARYVEFKKRADSIQRELEWIQNRIPKVIEKPKLVEAVNFLQNRSGVLLTSFSFATLASTTNASGSYTEIPVNIKFNSDFKGLLDFLYQVSLSNLFMTVHDLAIVPIQPKDPAHLNVTLTASMVLSGIQAKQ
jgi:Tfp pilus assembly protein PilO